jgi:hypothetical protein
VALTGQVTSRNGLYNCRYITSDAANKQGVYVMKAKPKPKTFKGRSLAPGGGGKFAMMESAMMKKGMPKEMADAVAAKAGMKKYGKSKMMAMASAGKKRAAKKK